MRSAAVRPKPITLTTSDAAEYDGPAPQPLLVVGEFVIDGGNP